MEIKQMIIEIKEKIDKAGGLKGVYFVACGGSLAAIYPAKYLIEAEAKNISTKIYNSNEFVYVTPTSLDERCIVICCSLKATNETVEAVKVANSTGAITIAMTGNTDTGMAKSGQYVAIYSNGYEQIHSRSNQSQGLRIGFEILQQFEGYEKYDAAIKAFNAIDEIIADSKKNMLSTAQKFAQDFKDDEVFHVLGCGPLYGTAYSMVHCHLMEMQCRHATLIHSGEYFHGPFELTDKKLAMVLLMSTGRSRFLDERVLKFMKTYAQHYIVIDAKDTSIEEKIDPAVAEFFNSVVIVPIERFFVAEMAEVRGHSMDYRRYMWKVEY